MVKKNLWLDKTPAREKASTSQNSGTGSWVTGVVREVMDGGLLRVGVPADDPVSEAVAPSDGNVTAVGAPVRVQVDPKGRAVHVGAPVTVPDGMDLVPSGTVGQWLADGRAQVDAAMADLTAQTEEAAAAAQASANAAMVAQNLAESKTAVTRGPAAPATPGVGDVWLREDAGGDVDGILSWDGAAWGPLRLAAGEIVVPGTVGAAQIADGAVTAPKVVASEELWAKVAAFASVTTDMLVAGGAAITGELLADVIHLGTKIIAGEPTGNAAVMDQTGLHVLRNIMGVQTEVITLSGGTEDCISITNELGTVAGISPDGKLTGQSLTVSGGMTWDGNDASWHLGRLSRGMIAVGEGWGWPATPRVIITGEMSVVDVSATLFAGRQYAVRVEYGWYALAAGTGMSVRVRMETAPIGSPVESPSASSKMIGDKLCGGIQSGRGKTETVIFTHVTVATDSNCRFLVSFGDAYVSGGSALDYSLGVPRISVIDEGPIVARTDNVNTSIAPAPAPPPPQKVERASQWTTTWHATFESTGPSSYMANVLAQGSYGGRTYNSMAGLPDMTATLEGATITNAALYVLNKHWYAMTGVASIGFHGAISQPEAFSTRGRWYEESGWARGEARWIQVPPNLWDGIKSGTYRGVTFEAQGQASYGYFDPAVALAVTYVK